ncbi:MAG: adenine phosphoribosyltransferase [Rhodomicrobiaceae bacterium]
MNNDELKTLVRTIPDYPKPGIMFRDVTTLISHGEGLRATINNMAKPFIGKGIDTVVGIEARGFILGGAIAEKLGVGFVPVRKKGKLPFDTISQTYELEYGTDELEIHTDSINQSAKVLIVDDLIATGGTLEAAGKLVKQLGGQIVAAAFIVDLPDIGGSKKCEQLGIPCHALMDFEGD